MRRLRLLLPLLLPLGACTYDVTDIHVALAPEVISSLDGTLGVRATVFHDEVPLDERPVQVTVEYVDRNGTAHSIGPVDGVSDDKGVFETTLSGFAWDGTGTITVTAPEESVSGQATFAVLDRTPPTGVIQPASATVTAGSDTQVSIHVQDEIGVSQVVFEAVANVDNNTVERSRSSVATAGSTDTTVTFEFGVRDSLTAGTTITLYALITDLSGNQRAATPVTITVTAP